MRVWDKPFMELKFNNETLGITNKAIVKLWLTKEKLRLTTEKLASTNKELGTNEDLGSTNEN